MYIIYTAATVTRYNNYDNNNCYTAVISYGLYGFTLYTGHRLRGYDIILCRYTMYIIQM